MKKTLLLSLAIFLAFNLFAQIPNGGFENWTNMGTYENPDQWATFNDLSALAGAPTPVTKTTDNFSGNFAMQLQAKTATTPFGVFVSPGLAVLGSIDFENENNELIGVPFTSRPTSLTGYLKYAPSGIDTAFVYVALYKWNNTTNQRDSIGGGIFATSTANSVYKKFTAPIIYTAGTSNPDTLLIVISSSNPENPNVQSVLIVDELAFTGISTPIAKSYSNEFGITLYPNPTANNAFIKNIPAEAAFIDITDFIGKNKQTISIKPGEIEINLSDYMPGVYFYNVRKNSGEIIYSSKFNIVK